MCDRYSMWIGETLRSVACDRSSGASVAGSKTGCSGTGTYSMSAISRVQLTV